MIFLSRNSIYQAFLDKANVGIKLLFTFIILYILSSNYVVNWIKLPILCLSVLLVLFYFKKINQPVLWYAFLMVLILQLICDYFVKANHHFLLIYITILIILFIKNHRFDNFVENLKWLIVIVLLFSAMQKLLSPQFLSGDFYYYMFNTGNFFKPWLSFNEDMTAIILKNKSQILELNKTDPNTLNSIYLQNIFPNINIISRVFAWITIAMEFIAAILFIWKPKNPITHLVFIILILGIFSTRLENGFLALLAISGIWLTENIKIRVIYTTLACVFIILIMLQIGFY